jgi:hypothetical protein
MKITLENYKEVIDQVGVTNLDAGQKMAHEVIEEGSSKFTDFDLLEELISEDPNTKEMIDLYFEQLEKKVKPKSEAPKVEKPKKVKAEKKVPKEEKDDEPEPHFKPGQTVYVKPDNEFYFEKYGNKAYTIKHIIVSKSGHVIPGRGASKPEVSYHYVMKEGDSFDEAYLTTKEPKANKEPKPKKADNAKPVEHYDVEMTFIRRFAGFLKGERAISSVLSFTKSLQKAIKEKKIQKHKDLIRQIQEKAISFHNAMKEQGYGSAKLELSKTPELQKKIEELAESEKVRASVGLIKRFIGMQGGSPTTAKVEALIKAIDHAFKRGTVKAEDIYFKEVKDIRQILDDFITKKRSNIRLAPAELNGLMGLEGIKDDLKRVYKANQCTDQNDIDYALKDLQRLEKFHGNKKSIVIRKNSIKTKEAALKKKAQRK